MVDATTKFMIQTEAAVASTVVDWIAQQIRDNSGITAAELLTAAEAYRDERQARADAL
jgi:hypothetical protein